nr:Cytochrome c biogenesis protein [Ishige okamurae]
MNFEIYSSFLLIVFFLCLFVSTIFYWISLIFTKLKRSYSIARSTSLIANIILFLFLANRWIVFGYFPLSNLYESLLFLSCMLLLVHRFLEYRTQSKLFGATLLPIILLITSFADLTLPLEMQKANALVPSLQSNWLMMHVSLMMLSYAVLIIGSLISILFLIVCLPIKANYEEKFTNTNYEAGESIINLITQQPIKGELEQLKTLYNMDYNSLLNNLDNWSYRTISLGFPFLTIGIIAGAVWANEAWGSYWSWDPKETWALITWLVFAAYLHVRLIKGWDGEKPAMLGSIGFFVVWICYLGVNFLGQGLHSYGWLR